MNKDLAVLLKGKTDVDEIARIVASYTKRSARKRSVAEERREWFQGIIGDVRKVPSVQVEALVYEYCMDNDGQWSFSAWLHNWYPVLFTKAKPDAVGQPEESDH